MAWNLQEAITYYKQAGAPRDQSALISLLREIQTEYGGIPRYLLEDICTAYGIKDSLLLALIRRIPSLRLSDSHCLQLCSGQFCGKAAELAKAAQDLQKASGGKFTLEFVPCMRMCGKGPNIRWDGQLHHKADEALLKKLLADAGINF